MKTLLFALVLLLPQFGAEMTHLRDYGVKIHVILPDGSEGGGSGVWVDDNLILSANHLWVSGAKFYTDDEHQKELVVTKWDAENDLLLFSTSGKHKHAKLGRMPKVNDDVLTLGHPRGAELMSIRGYVVAITPERLLIDSTVIRGMSGGGVYDTNGYLIGICVQSWGDQDQQFMVAISVDIIRGFLK